MCFLWIAIAAGRRLRPVLALLALTLVVWVLLAGWVVAGSAAQTISGPLWGYGVILLTP